MREHNQAAHENCSVAPGQAGQAQGQGQCGHVAEGQASTVAAVGGAVAELLTGQPVAVRLAGGVAGSLCRASSTRHFGV